MGLQDLRAYHNDQAAGLRALTHRKRRMATTLAITSGKGGVGKSNVAVNLSLCLASRGVRVTLVDCDLGLANSDLLMNIQPRYTLAHVMSGDRSMEAVCTEGPGGIRFVPGASGLYNLANLSDFERQNLITQLRSLEISADIVVLDCGAGISRNVIGFALAADRVLVVTTPQPPALTDAYATIKVILRDHYRGRVGLFVNMAESRAVAEASFCRLAKVAQRFLNYSIANQGYMLHDTAVELAVRQRCPFVIRYPKSNASACMVAAAAELAVADLAPQRRNGFFQRVAGLFV